MNKIEPIKEERKILEAVKNLYDHLDPYRKRVRRIYKWLRITREEAAQEIGLSATGLQNFDSGTSKPDPDVMLAIVAFIQKHEATIDSLPPEHHLSRRAKRLGLHKRKLENFEPVGESVA